MILYTSDLHFGHKNVIRFDHRPFASADEMDAFLIEMWNARVSPDDTVYILGDFSYRSAKSPEAYLMRLNGHKRLIIGNHDQALIQNAKAMSYFESAEPIANIADGDKDAILCHYPIAEWDGMHRGTWHIYGHIHNNMGDVWEFMKGRNALNAGCMLNGYAPCSFRELIRNKEYLLGAAQKRQAKER